MGVLVFRNVVQLPPVFRLYDSVTMTVAVMVQLPLEEVVLEEVILEEAGMEEAGVEEAGLEEVVSEEDALEPVFVSVGDGS